MIEYKMYHYQKLRMNVHQTSTLKRMMNMIVAVSLIVTLILLPVIEAKCPSREQSFCLQVDGFDTIILDGNKFHDIKMVFERISFLFEDSGETKELDQLYLYNNHHIKTLDRNAFGEFRFRRIVIENCTNLHRLHVDAFNGTRHVLKSLKINSIAINNLTQEDFFEALNSLEQLEELDLRNHRILKIRPYSFRQPRLTKLQLGGPLEELDNNVFFYLDSIRIIELSKSIRRIKKHAFDFKAVNNKSIDVYLDGKLGSIERGTFTSASRPLTINLYLSKMATFDASVFRPVLMAPIAHEILFHGHPNEMPDPCQLAWLFRHKFKGVVTFKDEPMINGNFFDAWKCSHNTPIDDGGNEVHEFDNMNQAGINATHNDACGGLLQRTYTLLATYILFDLCFILCIHIVFQM